MPGTYFACDMAALTAEQRAAHVRNLQRLFGAVERVTEITEGYSFSVPATPALFGQAAEFLVLERLCCPFFDFGVEWPAGATSFRLVITGAEGIKPFIQAEFGSALPPGVGFGGAPPTDRPVSREEEIMRSVVLYVVIALFEIAGCFSFWAWLRLQRSVWWLVPGTFSLVAFAVLLTRIEADFAGRAYAAYGGIYIAVALLWLVGVERMVPDRWDLVGSIVCVVGALIILLGPR